MNRLMMYLGLCMALATSMPGLATSQTGPVGFCNYNDGIDGITGGMEGPTVRVSTRQELARYLKSNDPYTIILDADLTGNGLDRAKDVLEVGSNTTLIGGGKGAALHGIGLNINGKQNIIIRNLTIHHADPDAIAGRNTHHVWVDHCDIYSTDEATREDWDGLIDFTIGSSYITVSYCYIHDHHKCCLLSSGTQHYEDYGKNRTTYHHNAFRLTDQRNPRIGYGLGHVFNNYYEQIGSYCIGGFTQSRILAEGNYFTATAHQPFCQMYGTEGPDDYSYAFFSERDNYTAKPWSYSFGDIDFDPADWYDYDFALDPANNIGQLYPDRVGPQVGLEREVIMWPGNGAKYMPVVLQPRWGSLADEQSSWMEIGTDPNMLQARTIDDENPLQPGTTYYWRVLTTVGEETIQSPLQQFTTAPERPSVPYPADGETYARLRAATSETAATTPMSLRWHPACDADYYLVSLWDEGGHAVADGVQVTCCSYNPGSLLYGQRYTWQVNAVGRLTGELTLGDVWSFSTPCRPISEGRTELEHLCRSGVVYIQPMTAQIWFAASNDSIALGDRGPGALSGVFAGQSGTYSVSLRFLDGSKGKDWFGIYVNDALVESWKSGSTSGLTSHKVSKSLHLQPGDQLRIDFYTTSGQRARMDCMDLTLLEADGIEPVLYNPDDQYIYYDLSGRRVTTPQPGKIYLKAPYFASPK